MNNNVQSVGPALQALNEQYLTITQNLANANTVGYKRSRTAFVQSLANEIASGSAQGPGLSTSNGFDFSAGSLTATGAPLDLAIEGKGFFVIETPQGEQYTRNGGFRLSANRQLVDSLGRLVAGANGPLTMPANVASSQIAVTADGQIKAGNVTVGKLKLVDFTDPNVLKSAGGGCYTAPKGVDPELATKSTVHQGFQESSNVSVVEELVGLISVSRMYEANIRSIQTGEDGSKDLLRVAMT